MRKRVKISETDHALLKAHAALSQEPLHAAQLRAIRRVVAAYQSAPHTLAATARAVEGELVRQSWQVDNATWTQFVDLRDRVGLTNSQLLHVATKLETEDKPV